MIADRAPFDLIPPKQPVKQHSIFQPILAVIVALVWLCSSVRASTVFWGSQFNDLLFDSQGVALDGNYSFEIGSFTSGFVPTMHNISQWQANWKVLDRIFDPTPADPNDGDPQGWNEPLQFFVGTVDHTITGTSSAPDANPLDVFAQGDVAYLWAYNSKNIVPGSEWALVADGSQSGDLGDDWTFVSPTNTNSFNWQLTDANDAIIGGANGVREGGTFSATPTTFSLQTAVVPEPGSALLLLAAAATHFIRRARRLSRTSML